MWHLCFKRKRDVFVFCLFQVKISTKMGIHKIGGLLNRSKDLRIKQSVWLISIPSTAYTTDLYVYFHALNLV